MRFSLKNYNKVGFFIIIVCVFVAGCSVQLKPSLDGSQKLNYVRPEWFGAVNDGETDCTKAIQEMFDYMAKYNIYTCRFNKCNYKQGRYYRISKTIYIKKPVKIEGRNAFISSNSLITLREDPNQWYYLTDGVAFYFVGEKGKRHKQTDICINIKTHAKPFFFDRSDNIYVHDCYVSTYTGDTLITNGIKTHWFAFQCDELSYARFENIVIDQPTNKKTYNFTDGIHLSGGCHDIIIKRVQGQSGDDFIAMNANENHPGNIYNVTIKDCIIGKEKASGAGIRFYGSTRLSGKPDMPQLSISNVSVSNCYIRTYLSPCVFFTNNGFWGHNDNESLKLSINGIIIQDCTLLSESRYWENTPTVWIGGTECNGLELNHVCVEKTNKTPFIALNGYNDLNSIKMIKCHYKSKKGLQLDITKEDAFVKSKTEINNEAGIITLGSNNNKNVRIENNRLIVVE